MSEGEETRRLAAILATDVVGYSRLMGADENGTLAALRSHRSAVLSPAVARHEGRIFKLMGDGALAVFHSAAAAVECAIEIQIATAAAVDKQIRLRVGVHLGDVVLDGDDVYGDGVNIAARLEALADPCGICVSGAVRDSVAAILDAAFEDAGEIALKNIDRKVRVHHWRAPPDDDADPRPSTAPAGDSGETGGEYGKSDPPSVAVLPFKCNGGDDDLAVFAEGLTDEITVALSRLSGLFVIARGSSVAAAEDGLGANETALKLGVRYALRGGVRASGDRLRVSVELLDALESRQVWAERYDGRFADVFELQDEISIGVATELQVQLTDGEQARRRYVATDNVAAWKHWTLGLVELRRGIRENPVRNARDHWIRAVELDPNAAPIHALLALTYAIDARFGWWNEKSEAIEMSEMHALAALNIDPNNADATSVLSLVRLLQNKFDEVRPLAQRALSQAPESADVAAFAAVCLHAVGHPAESETAMREAMRISPIHPDWYLGDLGFALRMQGKYDEAIEAFREYGRRNPGFGHIDLAIIQIQLGNEIEAYKEAKSVLAARPAFTISAWRQTQFSANSAQLEADCAALRAAGLPE